MDFLSDSISQAFPTSDPASALAVSTREPIWSMLRIHCPSTVKHCRVWHVPGGFSQDPWRVSGTDWD